MLYEQINIIVYISVKDMKKNKKPVLCRTGFYGTRREEAKLNHNCRQHMHSDKFPEDLRCLKHQNTAESAVP